VTRVLADFVEGARLAFGAVSAQRPCSTAARAEAQLRPPRTVNVIVVLAAFDAARRTRCARRCAPHTRRVRLTAMFLLDSEVAAARRSLRREVRRRVPPAQVLHGTDSIRGHPAFARRRGSRGSDRCCSISGCGCASNTSSAACARNRFALLVADAAAPLRAAAAALLELEGKPVASPKQALETVVRTLPEPGREELLRHMSDARATARAEPGQARPAMVG
jgi:hypothetical protein